MAFTILTGGSFTSEGIGVRIPLPSSADYFRTWNVTQYAATNPNTVVAGEWFGSKFGAGASAAGLGLKTVKTTGLLTSNFGANLGFTYIETVPYVEAQAANAITAISLTNPAVVTQTNTYAEGDFVRIYNTTGDLTIGGMVFQISTVTGSDYELLGLPNTANNGLAAATAGNTRRVSKYAAVEPEFLYVTNISPGTATTVPHAGTIVSVSVDPSAFYVVGMKVHFSVPKSFGMSEINGLTGTITEMNVSNTGGADVAAYNFVVDIDSSTFTAFAFPVTTLSPTAQLFATVAPAGQSTQYNPVTLVQTGYDFNKAPFHTGQFTPYMYLAAGAQAAAGAEGDVVNWMAYKLEN